VAYVPFFIYTPPDFSRYDIISPENAGGRVLGFMTVLMQWNIVQRFLGIDILKRFLQAAIG
jgi:hypothetical protein